tara:strand:+ start:8087 stop:8845 length:759 start_codon:yes stop_codon:yes gene_type:complete
MNFSTIYDFIILPWIGLGIFAFLTLFFITAPYGRHNKKMGPMMSGKWGWIIQEIISPLTFAHFFIRGDSIKTPEMWIFFILWVGHYFNRSIIFPFRQKYAKDTAVIVVISAISFNIINGFINGYYLGSAELSQNQYTDYFQSYNFILGLIIFISGAYINIRSDEILFNLRKENDGYKIPQSFLYKYISCPNYFGEIIEWTGFAIMVWNVPGFVFVLWTIFNLVPRAVSHHKWYKERFSDYPSSRKAIIPFIL